MPEVPNLQLCLMKPIEIGYLKAEADSVWWRSEGRREHLNCCIASGDRLAGVEGRVDTEPFSGAERRKHRVGGKRLNSFGICIRAIIML